MPADADRPDTEKDALPPGRLADALNAPGRPVPSDPDRPAEKPPTEAPADMLTFGTLRPALAENRGTLVHPGKPELILLPFQLHQHGGFFVKCH